MKAYLQARTDDKVTKKLEQITNKLNIKPKLEKEFGFTYKEHGVKVILMCMYVDSDWGALVNETLTTFTAMSDVRQQIYASYSESRSSFFAN